MAKKDELVVDSSVVAKWFLTEPGSDKAIMVRDGFATWRLKLAVPTLELSAELSVRGDLTVYDACYVALAQRIGSKVITEDREIGHPTSDPAPLQNNLR